MISIRTPAEKTRSGLLEIGFECLRRDLSKGHDAFLACLAQDTNQERPAIDGRERQADQFGNTQPRAVKHLEHGDIAQFEGLRSACGLY